MKKKTILLVATVNVLEDYVDPFVENLDKLVKMYKEECDYFNIKIDESEEQDEDLLRVKFCSVFTIRENSKIKYLKNNFYNVISSFGVTDQIMSRFKVFKKVNESRWAVIYLKYINLEFWSIRRR